MLFPTKYDITAKVANTIMIGPIANQSSPSVKFTAFDDPTITSIEKINQK